jgi:signal transduction histidine kinase
MPHLSTFIQDHIEEILQEWEAFARELPSTSSMDVAALRDHAEAMLLVIARDLETPQSERERAEKSRGIQDAVDDVDSAASQHGLGRAESGFGVDHMIAEFRALRASVVSLWRKQQKHEGSSDLEEITRFHEAIDQAIAESMAEYTRAVETTRDRFFAVLGHDLRTPLGVILMSSQFLLETGNLSDSERTLVTGMEKSGRRMIELVRDLLDLALTRLGSGIPLKCAPMDMDVLVREVVAEVAGSSPASRIEVETSGDLTGAWDKARLGQAFSNLVSNAVQHGSQTAPIRVAARGDVSGKVTVSVANEGPPIPRDQISGIFDAMKGQPDNSDRRHLGLGLYIVDKIVEAHGGTIDIHSAEGEGTTFIVSLPRRNGAGPNGGTPRLP